VIAKTSISDAAARRAVEAAREKAAELGIAVTISVLDEGGLPKAFLRMDGAPLAGIEIAPVKARTAVLFRAPTSMWRERVETNQLLPVALVGLHDRVSLLKGGVPLVVDGAVVGAVGVSGGSEDQDDLVAGAAAERALAS